MRPLAHLGLFLMGTYALAWAGPHAQDTAPGQVLSVRTELVTLTVTVVDSHGGFVAGLRGEHFTVYDNGVPRKIEFFSSEDIPATVGLVIDSSTSMLGRRDEVAAAAAAFADMVHPLGELFTLNFNEAIWPGLPPHVAFSSNREELRAALSAPARGMTALYDAVHRGLQHLEQGTRDRKALILVSDGGDNASTSTLESVLEHARRTSAVIYAVTLVDSSNHDARPQVLTKLANETGGEVFRPRRPEETEASFARIARELKAGYTIGFEPPEISDGGFRSIRVVVDTGDRRHLIARTRAGYYARPSN